MSAKSAIQQTEMVLIHRGNVLNEPRVPALTFSRPHANMMSNAGPCAITLASVDFNPD